MFFHPETSFDPAVGRGVLSPAVKVSRVTYRTMTPCPYCSREFPSDQIPPRHKGTCPGWVAALTASITPCLCGFTAPSDNKMKDHYRECPVWQARDKKAVLRSRVRETSLKKYGVEDPTQTPGAKASRAATNSARYGAENPFARGATTFDQVQAALVGKRPVLQGKDNPFSRPEVKAKLRETMNERYGAPNPQQVPEIRARTDETSRGRYGGVLRGSPELKARIAETNLARYGCVEPSSNPEVVERIRQTNLARYGVEWTNQDPEVRRKQLETMTARYGAHYFASEEGKREIRAVFKERYGVEFPGAIEGHWDKAIATFRKNHEGLVHPLQLAQPDKGPNKVEALLLGLSPDLIYTGNQVYWRFLPRLGRNKNPDFLVPGPDPENPRSGITKVVEVFGDFWHSRMMTGKAPFDHEQELLEAYAEVGLRCLIVWEGELKRDPEGVRVRLQEFLNAP